MATARKLAFFSAIVSAASYVGAQDAYVLPVDTPAHIRRAVESSTRPEDQSARDPNRKPAETLMLAGIEPGDHVIEVAGFGQYYTMLLAEAVGPEGHVDVYDLPYTEQFAGAASRAFAAAHANVTYHQEDYNAVEFPANVDAVLNILYYHDLKPNNVDTAAMNAKLLAALEAGGIYLVIDHKAEDGSGWRDAATIHRMGVETIREEVTAAGFELALESDLLANPDDDRTQMVFTPGVRGHTDQAVFVFRKPAP
jgi:predicted methyltransferase